jgi:hypothetical protein
MGKRKKKDPEKETLTRLEYRTLTELRESHQMMIDTIPGWEERNKSDFLNPLPKEILARLALLLFSVSESLKHFRFHFNEEVREHEAEARNSRRKAIGTYNQGQVRGHNHAIEHIDKILALMESSKRKADDEQRRKERDQD